LQILEEQRPLWFPSLLDFLTKAVQELRQFALAMQDRAQAQQQLQRQKQRERERRKVNRDATGVRRKKKKKTKQKKGKRDEKGKQKDNDDNLDDREDEEDDDSDVCDERGTVKKARKACRIADEAVEDDSGYMFRILLPFLANLFGGPFNPLEIPNAQADVQGLDLSMVPSFTTSSMGSRVRTHDTRYTPHQRKYSHHTWDACADDASCYSDHIDYSGACCGQQ
jgi:hypothetical protein